MAIPVVVGGRARLGLVTGRRRFGLVGPVGPRPKGSRRVPPQLLSAERRSGETNRPLRRFGGHARTVGREDRRIVAATRPQRLRRRRVGTLTCLPPDTATSDEPPRPADWRSYSGLTDGPPGTPSNTIRSSSSRSSQLDQQQPSLIARSPLHDRLANCVSVPLPPLVDVATCLLRPSTLS